MNVRPRDAPKHLAPGRLGGFPAGSWLCDSPGREPAGCLAHTAGRPCATAVRGHTQDGPHVHRNDTCTRLSPGLQGVASPIGVGQDACDSGSLCGAQVNHPASRLAPDAERDGQNRRRRRVVSRQLTPPALVALAEFLVACGIGYHSRLTHGRCEQQRAHRRNPVLETRTPERANILRAVAESHPALVQRNTSQPHELQHVSQFGRSPAVAREGARRSEPLQRGLYQQLNVDARTAQREQLATPGAVDVQIAHAVSMPALN